MPLASLPKPVHSHQLHVHFIASLSSILCTLTIFQIHGCVPRSRSYPLLLGLITQSYILIIRLPCTPPNTPTPFPEALYVYVSPSTLPHPYLKNFVHVNSFLQPRPHMYPHSVFASIKTK